MKANINWFGYTNYSHGERNFENNKSNNRLKANIFIVKNKNSSANEFSDLLLQEFKGQKVVTADKFFPGNSHEFSGKPGQYQDRTISSQDLKAVQFLNEYWA